MSQQAAGGTPLPGPTASVSLPTSGEIIGYVAGGVRRERHQRRLAGHVVLLVMVIVGSLATLAQIVVNGAPYGVIIVDLCVLVALATGVWLFVTGKAPRPRPVRVDESASRINVRPATGGEVACVWSGRHPLPDLGHGETVRITGRRSRSGEWRLRRIEVLGSISGPVLRVATARPPLGERLRRWADRACYALSAALGVWTVIILIWLT
jgi:hypothetical protein